MGKQINSTTALVAFLNDLDHQMRRYLISLKTTSAHHHKSASTAGSVVTAPAAK